MIKYNYQNKGEWRSLLVRGEKNEKENLETHINDIVLYGLALQFHICLCKGGYHTW